MNAFDTLWRSIKKTLPEKDRKTLRRFRKRLVSFFIEMSEVASFCRKGEPKVYRVIDGRGRANFEKPLCVFSSYDSDSSVKAYVYYYLAEIARAGCDIVFVTTSARLDPFDETRLSQLCMKVIHRENRGYDFYSWKIGILQCPRYEEYDGVLLLNDSVVGPFVPFATILARLIEAPSLVVGMTDSLRFFPHIQSYFFFVKRDEKTWAFLKAFFERVKPYEDKNIIIRKYEVGFSRMASNGISLGALYPVCVVRERFCETSTAIDDINQPVDFWRELITEYKFPYLKKSILSKGHEGVSSVSAAISAAGFAFDSSLFPHGE